MSLDQNIAIKNKLNKINKSYQNWESKKRKTLLFER